MTKKPSGYATKPKPWTEMATHLVDVAMGRKPADLVIRNGRWVNVHSGEVIAAVHIHGPSYRFPKAGTESAMAQLVVTGAAKIAAGLRER